jgi:hypothetical protein
MSFGGGASTPRPSPPPPPLPPPQQVADPAVFREYQRKTAQKRGFAATMLTGGQGLVGQNDQSFAAPTLGAG